MSKKEVKISEMGFGKSFDDYPDDTIFILDEDDEDDWSDVENIKD